MSTPCPNCRPARCLLHGPEVHHLRLYRPQPPLPARRRHWTGVVLRWLRR